MEGETEEQSRARMQVMAAARIAGVTPDSLTAAAKGGEPMEQRNGESLAEFVVRIRKATGQVASTGAAAAPARPRAAANRSGSATTPDILEIRRLQAACRAQGMTQTTGGDWVRKPSLKMSFDTFKAACMAEFDASPALRVQHGNWPAYAVARQHELQEAAKQRDQVGASGLPRWLEEARRAYAASPALQQAFASEHLYLCHVLAEQDR